MKEIDLWYIYTIYFRYLGQDRHLKIPWQHHS